MAQSDTAHDRNLLSATVKAEILNNDDSTLDNNFSGKAIDFQFSIQPKVEQSEIKDEVEELEFVGEVIEFSENELSGLEESQEPNYGTTKESYWCEQCNAESCYKKHDLHADFIRITTKPLNQSNPYECATCSIKLLNPTIALFHLSLHDKDSFRCYKCNCILLEFSDFLEHIEKLHSKDKDYYRCVECNFVTFWHLQYADHNNKFHKPKLFHKCKLCDEFWPSRNHSLHEKMLHIKSKYGRNPYVCKKCEIELVDPDEIYDHLKIHGDIGIFCSFCAFTSENLEDLENHKKDNHAEEVEKQRIIRESCKEYMENDNDIKCDLCNRYWPDKIHSNHERMILVEKQVTEDNPYKCTACNKKTCNLREVYKHVNRYCRYTMKCPFCSKVFRRRQGLDNHVIREHPGKKYVMDNPILKCKLCEYSTVVRKNFHSHLFSHKSKEDRPQYNCNECNFTTYNSSYLKKHRLIKHPVESDTLHTCDKCTYSTYLTSRMTKHLKTHVDNEIFKCDICNGLFGRERSLQRHKARHFQEKKEKKQYVCEICAKVYYFKPSLLQHLYCAHQQGEAKIYMCYSCTYKSSNRTKFIAHTKVHTKQEFLYCANCEYKTVRKLNLIQHMVKHADSSKLQLHKCKVCSFETKRAHTLRNHVKYTHGTL